MRCLGVLTVDSIGGIPTSRIYKAMAIMGHEVTIGIFPGRVVLFYVFTNLLAFSSRVIDLATGWSGKWI